MDETVNQKKPKKEVQNLADLTSWSTDSKKGPNPRFRNYPIYRSVLGCSLSQNSKSRQTWDEKLTEKEESKPLTLGGR
jgi:hypothetical protein